MSDEGPVRHVSRSLRHPKSIPDQIRDLKAEKTRLERDRAQAIFLEQDYKSNNETRPMMLAIAKGHEHTAKIIESDILLINDRIRKLEAELLEQHKR